MAPRLPASLQRAILAHCRGELPQQACGLLLFDFEGCARSVEPVRNQGAWPYGFEIPAAAQYVALRKAVEHGWRLGGVYHCHLVSAAVPTGRDLRRPVPPGFLYVVVSMLFPERPELRTYLFEGGVPHEVAQPHWTLETSWPC